MPLSLPIPITVCIKGILPIAKNSKDIKTKIARQEIFVNKLKGRLETFNEVWKNPDQGKQKLETLKKEMSELNPQKPTPSVGQENIQKVEERLKTLEQKITALTTEVHSLEGRR